MFDPRLGIEPGRTYFCDNVGPETFGRETTRGSGGRVRVAQIFAPLFVISFSAFGQTATAPAQYSFTISGSQTWTDTGVDLAAGDSLALSAEAKPGSDAKCSPAGSTSAVGDSRNIPLPASPAGTLIVRTAENSAAVVVGTGTDLKSDNAGHLFLGVNENAASSCSFLVKVQISHTQSASVAAGSPAANGAQDAPAPNANSTASPEHPNMKSQLSSAAQVWLKGQFGSNSASSSNTQASNAINGDSTNATGTGTSGGLKLPPLVLDSNLRQQLDSLPRRIHDHAGNLGDMVNFVMVGTQDQMQAAVGAADWHLADLDSKEAGLKAVLDTYEKKDYLQMPMSHLYLFDRMQDFGYEQAQAFSVVASRHHFRIWKAPFTWNNQTVWVGAATHDIGFEKDIRTGKLTHKIDPNVDDERESLGQGLEKTGKTKSMTYYLPPNPVQEAKNASGGSYHSDGRLLVVFLK